MENKGYKRINSDLHPARRNLSYLPSIYFLLNVYTNVASQPNVRIHQWVDCVCRLR